MYPINDSLKQNTETKTCPQCQKQMPVIVDYLTWCEYCDYNVNPSVQKESTPISRLYERLGDRLGERMVESIKEGIVPTARIPKLMAYLIATLVHMISFNLFVGGLICLFFLEKNFFIYVATFVLFGLSWVLRPRMNRLKKGQAILSRDEYPTLYKLCDKISEEMNVSRVDGIVIDDEFNASITEVGWRRRVIVTIGLPMFSILEAEERLGVLAHEIGHKVNKDLSRSFYIGTAISTLETWFDLLHQEKPGNGELENGLSFVEFFSYYVMKGISFIPFSLIYLLNYLLFRNKQVAEFRADLFEAEVVGSQTAIQTLEKFHYHDLFSYISRKVALNNKKLNLFQELRDRMASLPERERKRLQRKTELEKTRVDTTHPPTFLRMKLLKAKTIHPLVRLTSAEASSLQTELEKMEEDIQEKVIDKIKYSLYQ